MLTNEMIMDLGMVSSDKGKNIEVISIDHIKKAFESPRSRSLPYHMYSVWLFNFSDLKTIVFPQTTFGIATALSGPLLMESLPSSDLKIMGRLPLVGLWVWMNLLPFAIDNQRQPRAIQEDSLNKPWRSMPSNRLTPGEARTLMFVGYAAAVLLSKYLGAMKPCMLLILFGWVYNDLDGADRNPVVRNIINGLGYSSFASGATIIASGHTHLNQIAYCWLLMIGAVVVTTVQLQDMADQEGDSIRGRRTVPLVLGDGPARWTIAIPVAFWSFVCPAFWSSPLGCIPSVVLGIIVSARVLSVRTLKADKLTFKLWNLWMMILYLIPLIKRCTGR